MRIALLIVAYAVVGAIVYLFVGGSRVAPCLGGPGIDNGPCAAAWLATRPWQDWFLSTPYPEIVGVVICTTATIWLARRSRTA